MSWPAKRIVPAAGAISRTSVRPSVVFPEPDSPTMPTTVPSSIGKVEPVQNLHHRPAAEEIPPLRVGKRDAKAADGEERLAHPLAPPSTHSASAAAISRQVASMTSEGTGSSDSSGRS